MSDENDNEYIQIDSLLRVLQKTKNYTFRSFPYKIWIGSFILLMFSVFFYVFLLTFKSFSLFTLFLNIFLIFFSFYIFSYGYIETVYFDKKSVKISQINLFLSKRSLNVPYEDINYITIVQTGIKQGANDNSKFIIRLSLKTGHNINWGDTLIKNDIKFKYQVALAIAKEIILPIVSDIYIKDEVKYKDYY